MIYRLVFGLLFFFVFYRLDLGGTGITFNLILGLIFLFLIKKNTLSFRKVELYLIISLVILFIFSSLVDLYLINEINTMNAYFTVRIISIFILTYCSAQFFKKLFLKNIYDLFFLMRFAILLQLFFFFFLYFLPEYKSVVYSFFGASESVNLLEWNMNTRGFGVGSEINYTAPVLTVIISYLAFKSIFPKIIVFLTQVINANTTVITLLFTLQMKRIKIAFFVLVIFLFTISFWKDIIFQYFPRLNEEFGTGFTRTLFSLLSNHFFMFNNSFFEYIFGVPIMVMPGANNFYSSDSGWVIMMNYGGVFFIMMFILILFLLIINMNTTLNFKIIFLLIGLLLNFKGLVLGPNSFFFIIFLLSKYGYNSEFNKSLHNNLIC